MASRRALWLGLLPALAFIALLGTATIRTRPAGQASRAPGPATTDGVPIAVEDDSPDASSQETPTDWKSALLVRLPELASALGDLGRMPLERALRLSSLAPRPRHRVVRDGAAFDVVTYEPTDWADIELAIPFLGHRGDEDNALRAINQILLDHVIDSDAKAHPERAADELMSILVSTDDALGDSAEARRLLQATRWQVAVGLRRVPLAPHQEALLDALCTSHPDDVLRGAIAGALLARRESDAHARAWLARERAPRAVQALLVELTRRDSVWRFPASCGATLEGEGDDLRITGSGGLRFPKPVSGPHMFDTVAALFAAGVGRNEPPSDAYAGGGSDGTRGLLVEALCVRADASKAPALVQIIDGEHDPIHRARLIRALAHIPAPETVGALARFAGMSRSDDERQAAVIGLARSAGPSSVPALEGLLWDEDPAIRIHAGQGLEKHRAVLSPRARARITELARQDPSGVFATIAQTLAWHDAQPR